MAEQKFLGEAGLDVLVGEVKTKLDTHQTFYELWKADCYSFLDYLEKSNENPDDARLRDRAVGKFAFVYFHLLKVADVYNLTALNDKLESLNEFMSTPITSWPDDAGDQLRAIMDDVFNCDLGISSEFATSLQWLVEGYDLCWFINKLAEHPQAAEITSTEVTNKFT